MVRPLNSAAFESFLRAVRNSSKTGGNNFSLNRLANWLKISSVSAYVGYSYRITALHLLKIASSISNPLFVVRNITPLKYSRVRKSVPTIAPCSMSVPRART